MKIIDDFCFFSNKKQINKYLTTEQKATVLTCSGVKVTLCLVDEKLEKLHVNEHSSHGYNDLYY